MDDEDVQMSRRYIVKGQKVESDKKQVSRRLRREMTPEEHLLWAALRDNQLGSRVRRQQVISGFIIDFYCHEHGLIIEADGAHHSQESDRERDAVLAARGLRIVRFSNYRIRDEMPRVLAEIRDAMR
jgi:very-short-patch-repair endonuclease